MKGYTASNWKELFETAVKDEFVWNKAERKIMHRILDNTVECEDGYGFECSNFYFDDDKNEVKVWNVANGKCIKIKSSTIVFWIGNAEKGYNMGRVY